MGFTAFITTYNRGSWVGACVGMFIMISLDLFARGSKHKKVAMGLMSFGVLVVLVGSIKFGSLIIDRFMNSDADGQIDNRSEQTHEAIELIKQNPIVGVGYKNDDFYAREIFVHNNYLLIAAEFGIPGLLFYFWFIGNYLALIIGGIRSKVSFVSNYSKGFLASIIAFSIASIPGPDFWIAADVQRQFLIVLAVLISARRLESKLIEIQKNKKLNKSKIDQTNIAKLSIIDKY
ncbi:MAG: O-antigen ligase domain-containing protein [Calditrichaeota bacterium]|nr:MAG: O-antigen ligase domain-containing protein [Calditrichota bacterium]